MGVGAGLYMCDVVKKKFTFAISSPDEFLLNLEETTVVTRIVIHPISMKFGVKIEVDD